MKVVGCARRQERVDDLAKQLKEEQGRLYSRRCDVAVESEIRELFNWIEEHPDLGKVDVCINNAGLSAAETLMDGKVEDWRRMLDVNVLALCLATQLSIKSMTKHGIDDGQVTCSLLGFTSETNFNILGGDGELLLRSQGASKPLNQVSLCFVFNPVFQVLCSHQVCSDRSPGGLEAGGSRHGLKHQVNKNLLVSSSPWKHQGGGDFSRPR